MFHEQQTLYKLYFGGPLGFLLFVRFNRGNRGTRDLIRQGNST